MAGIEVDILADGALDLSDSVLEQMDVVVASVHSVFSQEPAADDRPPAARDQQSRTCRSSAIPPGRLLLRRDAYTFDMEAVLKTAAENKVAMELNAYPDRLDLNDVHLRMARERGVKIVINTDAHHTSHFEKIKYGILQARRAWLTSRDILNTLPEQEFRKAMKHVWPVQLATLCANQSESPKEPLMPNATHKHSKREFDAGHVPITEEFDSPRRTLPPALPLAIALVVVVVFIVGVAYIFRSKPVAQGQIDNVFISQKKDQPNSMLAIQVTLKATGDKPLYIKGITAELNTLHDSYTDEAASASDYGRYFQGYPELKDHAMKPIAVEDKIPPGAQESGTVIVSFPVDPNEFQSQEEPDGDSSALRSEADRAEGSWEIGIHQNGEPLPLC